MAKSKKTAQRHTKKTTLIIVGEGLHEKAFLAHMKELYDRRDSGQTIKLDTANGGSPHDIIKATIKKVSHRSYDRKFILMDSDVAIVPKDLQLARNKGIQVLLSEPFCLEGMLLDILSLSVPDNAIDCKKKLHPLLDGSPTLPQSYASQFPKPVLDAAEKQTIADLRLVLSNRKAN